ncbi:hypothetical protein [Cohnella terricola]|uniref:Uncharacterized protein n=1 Tax=Cohnella terricola TaxID=1289167 RepID=A0A559JQ24_9BACL|nr:hypothetical protein [Cohnella terricola]TVY01953.1 hypothetical protein FPZ45_05775 [Cohnella terricola]
MNRYLKLVHMEIYRFRYMLAILMGLTAVCQIVGLVLYLNSEVQYRYSHFDKFGQWPDSNAMSFARALFGTQGWFAIPVVLCIAALILYAFLIWYRDWFGRSTFIYRLLMLPTARRHIYLAKLTALITFIFALVGFQLVLLSLEKWIFAFTVPAELTEHSYIAEAIEANRVLATLLPRSFEQFMYAYGIGIMAVIVAFTAILIERSFRLIGIVYAAFYVAACLLAVVFPIYTFGIDRSNAYLYPEEVFGIECLICILVISVSVWLGFRLLAKKITV